MSLATSEGENNRDSSFEPENENFGKAIGNAVLESTAQASDGCCMRFSSKSLFSENVDWE